MYGSKALQQRHKSGGGNINIRQPFHVVVERMVGIWKSGQYHGMRSNITEKDVLSKAVY